MRTTRVSARPIGLGDVAPDFALPTPSEELITLSGLVAAKNVVLFFYPKDQSDICTAEACAFRDRYEAFVAHDTEVVGISSDSTRSHGRFVSRHQLPFIVLTDVGGKVRKHYGVPDTIGSLAGRATYVVDRQRIVRHVYSSQFNAVGHVVEALNAVHKLSR